MLWVHKLHNVDDIPPTFFVKHKHIYARVEEVVPGSCGVLLRVRHVPGYATSRHSPTDRIKGDFEHETLLVRLHGIDTECIHADIQPDAMELIGKLVFHKMVEIMFMQKEGDDHFSHSEQSAEPSAMVSSAGSGASEAIAIVRTVVEHPTNALSVLVPPKPKDLSIVLTKAGLARPTKAYRMDVERQQEMDEAAQHAKLDRLGMWAKKYRSEALKDAHGNPGTSLKSASTHSSTPAPSSLKERHHHNKSLQTRSDHVRSSTHSYPGSSLKCASTKGNPASYHLESRSDHGSSSVVYSSHSKQHEECNGHKQEVITIP